VYDPFFEAVSLSMELCVKLRGRTA
jgi:hypothetical protein